MLTVLMTMESIQDLLLDKMQQCITSLNVALVVSFLLSRVLCIVPVQGDVLRNYKVHKDILEFVHFQQREH